MTGSSIRYPYAVACSASCSKSKASCFSVPILAKTAAFSAGNTTMSRRPVCCLCSKSVFHARPTSASSSQHISMPALGSCKHRSKRTCRNLCTGLAKEGLVAGGDFNTAATSCGK
eukprot:scaffold34622_cov162-Amphora_coffeaeformis.AAC.10